MHLNDAELETIKRQVRGLHEEMESGARKIQDLQQQLKLQQDDFQRLQTLVASASLQIEDLQKQLKAQQEEWQVVQSAKADDKAEDEVMDDQHTKTFQ